MLHLECWNGSETQYSNCRTGLTKVAAFITTIDDKYNVYGTLDEVTSYYPKHLLLHNKSSRFNGVSFTLSKLPITKNKYSSSNQNTHILHL